MKIAGKRAYDLARDGEVFELEPRPVRIHALKLIEISDAETAVFEARCCKGTYVRALARDMGRALGCLGHLVALRRTRVAGFDEALAISLARLEDAVAEGEAALARLLLPGPDPMSWLATCLMSVKPMPPVCSRASPSLCAGAMRPTCPGRPMPCAGAIWLHSGKSSKANCIQSAYSI